MDDSFLALSIDFLPFDILQTKSGWILSRGVHQFILNGKNADQLITFLRHSQSSASSTVADILLQYPKSIRWDALHLLFDLYQRKFIIPSFPTNSYSKESAEDLFYWHFHTNEKEIKNTFAHTPILIVGINNLSIKVYNSLVESGFQTIEFIDDITLRSEHTISIPTKSWSVTDWNKSKSKVNPNCIIACAEAGGVQLLTDWNTYCVGNKIPFFPIYIYQLVGYVGPWILPGETACLECLVLRKNAVLSADEVAIQLEYNEPLLKTNTAYLPSLLSICAEHAVFEIGAHVGKLSIRKYNSQLSINLLSGTTTNNKLLKQPRCTTCSKLHVHGAYSPLKRKL